MILWLAMADCEMLVVVVGQDMPSQTVHCEGAAGVAGRSEGVAGQVIPDPTSSHGPSHFTTRFSILLRRPGSEYSQEQ